ncbi:hypothetical protein BDB01DRAFT_903754 [Pilobolus umbonatus]|nr:hypothetical protein BDB01DRAFT_903754 [Pilobolus umbonatus]
MDSKDCPQNKHNEDDFEKITLEEQMDYAPIYHIEEKKTVEEMDPQTAEEMDTQIANKMNPQTTEEMDPQVLEEIDAQKVKTEETWEEEVPDATETPSVPPKDKETNDATDQASETRETYQQENVAEDPFQCYITERTETTTKSMFVRKNLSGEELIDTTNKSVEETMTPLPDQPKDMNASVNSMESDDNIKKRKRRKSSFKQRKVLKRQKRGPCHHW